MVAKRGSVAHAEVPSIRHYLIVDPEGAAITHHRRMESGTIETTVFSRGDLMLDPPGLVVPLADVFAA